MLQWAFPVGVVVLLVGVGCTFYGRFRLGLPLMAVGLVIAIIGMRYLRAFRP